MRVCRGCSGVMFLIDGSCSAPDCFLLSLSLLWWPSSLEMILGQQGKKWLIKPCLFSPEDINVCTMLYFLSCTASVTNTSFTGLIVDKRMWGWQILTLQNKTEEYTKVHIKAKSFIVFLFFHGLQTFFLRPLTLLLGSTLQLWFNYEAAFLVNIITISFPSYLPSCVSGKDCQPRMCIITGAQTIGGTMWCPSPSVSTARMTCTSLPTVTPTPTLAYSTICPVLSKEI